MIAVAVRMAMARWGHALAVSLLACVAVGAAVAVPVYVAAARGVILGDDLAAASFFERTVSEQATVAVAENPNNPLEYAALSERYRNFDKRATSAVQVPGFRSVFSTQVMVALDAADSAPDLYKSPTASLQFRTGFCGQVRLLSGRCASAPGEIMIGPGLARTIGLKVGAGVTVLPYSTRLISKSVLVRSPDGLPGQLTVVGIYQPRDPTDLYWGPEAPLDTGTLPALTVRPTFSVLSHYEEFQRAYAFPGPDTFRPDELAAVDHRVRQAVVDSSSDIRASTEIPTLVTRVTGDFQRVAIAPLVGVTVLIFASWFVIFMAVVDTSRARRAEMGLLGVRGLSGSDRWWLAVAETALPVCAGAVAGFVLGQVAAAWFVRMALGAGASWRMESLGYAAVALVGALLTAVLALRADMRTRVVDLLRQVRRGESSRRAGLAATVVVVLAAGVAVQSDGATSGGADLGRWAPALVVTAVGLVAAGVFEVWARWWGGRALRQGRLGLGLGLLGLVRRRTAGRVVLLVFAVGLFGFAAVGTAVGARARVQAAQVMVGADRVVSVAATTPIRLLNAVRTVDPDGRYAMAAVVAQQPTQSHGEVIALDSSRLPAVALWPASTLSAKAAAERLTPPLPAPVVVRGTVTLTAGYVASPGDPGSPQLLMFLTALDGSSARVVVFPSLRQGRHDYAVVTGCAAGCRVVGLQFEPPRQAVGKLSVNLYGLRQPHPDTDLLAGAPFVQWQLDGAPATRSSQGGSTLRFAMYPSRGMPPLSIVPPDVPKVLPTLDAGSLLDLGITDRGGQLVLASGAAHLAVLPAVGGRGQLVDLALWARATDRGGDQTETGQVWLNADAPADVIDRLQSAGLHVTGERTVQAQARALTHQPSALGLRLFVFIAVVGLLLGAAGMAVAGGAEREPRAAELGALRVQGLSTGTVGRAAAISYLLPAVWGSITGVAAAAAAWALTGTQMPVIDHPPPGLDLSSLPWPSMGVAWAAAAIVLAVTALVLGGALTRAALVSGGE